MIKTICILLLLIVFPNDIKAIHEVIDARCTTMLKASLKEEAKDFNYRLAKNKDGDEVTYTSYFYGLSDNIDLIDEKGNKYNKVELNNLKQGTTLTINLYASSNSYCYGYKIGTRIIKIPYYNKYYGTDLCKGYENFYLCSENERILYDENEFLKKIKEYKENLMDKEENIQIDDVGKDNKKNVFDYFFQYKYYLIGGLLLVIITTLIVIIVNKTKNKGIL